MASLDDVKDLEAGLASVAPASKQHPVQDATAASHKAGGTNDPGGAMADTSPDSLTPDHHDGEKLIITWEENDPGNPINFPNWKKACIVLTTMFLIINSTMGSSLPSNAIRYIMADWDVTAQEQAVLPISTYLIGYVFGPLLWGPLSEHFGRRLITHLTFCFFILWTLGAALSPNWPALLIFRFLAGFVGSSPIAVVTGILADIFDDPTRRGYAMAFFMATTVFGPLFAPIISGFCATSVGWRWTFWVALIYAAVNLPAVLWLPETYAPALLTGRARRLRRADPGTKVCSAAEMEQQGLKQIVTKVLTRPIRMIFTELIVACTCIYLSLVYSIFYMSFQAFPLIFQGLYGLSPGVTGLCFLPIGGGALLALPVAYAYERILLHAQASNRRWSKQEEFRRLPLACIGGPVFFMSLFWLGWSASPSSSFVAPLLAGVPFGMGFMLIFIAMLNYVTDAYEIFAASANAAASTCRSTFAVVLPLATTPMFTRLGIPGACSLLGGLSALMCVIPFLFIWKGERIRAGSRFCAELKARKAERERVAEVQREMRVQRERNRQASDAERAKMDESGAVKDEKC